MGLPDITLERKVMDDHDAARRLLETVRKREEDLRERAFRARDDILEKYRRAAVPFEECDHPVISYEPEPHYHETCWYCRKLLKEE